MDYVPGRFARDEALAQLARDYVNIAGIEQTEKRIAECERHARQNEVIGCTTYAESFARHAEALRDALQIVKESKAA